MHVSILTLFPEMFSGPFDYSIIKRAKEKGIITISFVNIRNFAKDKYKTVDGRPFGGGTGMILRIDVVWEAITFAKRSVPTSPQHTNTILLDPKGEVYTQANVKNLSQFSHLILICGHYEGVDERITSLVDQVLSVGEYVLTGGELAAMCVVDSVARLVPKVIAKDSATSEESFSLHNGTSSLLEYPQFTEPRDFMGMQVPDILLRGNHAKIRDWRLNEAKKRTMAMESSRVAK